MLVLFRVCHVFPALLCPYVYYYFPVLVKFDYDFILLCVLIYLSI